MEKCIQCGQILEAGQTVCPGCGLALDALEPGQQKKRHSFGSMCGQCGALLPDGCSHCLVCGAPREQTVFEGRFPVPSELEPSESIEPAWRAARATRSTPELWRIWASTLSGAILLVLLSFAGLWVYQQYFDTSNYRAKEAIVYELSDGRLCLEYPGAQLPIEVRGVTLERTTWPDGVLHASGNGRWLAYTSATGHLYTIDLARPLTSNGTMYLEAVRLADDLAGPAEFSGGIGNYLVYLTKSRELYGSDLETAWKLDTNVEKIVGLEQRRVLYTRKGDETDSNRVDLFMDYLPEDGGQWLTIDRDVVEVLDWTDNFDKLLYTSFRRNKEGGDELCLYAFEQKTNTTTLLVNGVGQVADACAQTGTVYFFQPKLQQWGYGYFFEDDLFVQDVRITEPKLEDYPALAEAIRIYGEEGDFYNIEDNEELLEQDRLYNAQYDAWVEKLERDVLRQRLRALFSKRETFATLYDLYVYQGGELVMVDSNVWLNDPDNLKTGAMNAKLGYALYEKVDPASLRAVKISLLWRQLGVAEFSLMQYYREQVDRRLLYTPLNSEPAVLYRKNDTIVQKQWQMSRKGDGIYFTVGPLRPPAVDTPQDELYFAPVRNGELGDATRLAQQVHGLYDAFREGLVFDTGTWGERELFLAQAGSIRQLGGTDSMVGGVENEGSTLLYYDGYVEQTSAGALHMLTKEDVLLAQGVADYDYRNDQLVYIQKLNAQRNAMDIYVWADGREVLLVQNVRGYAESKLKIQ